MDSGLSVEPCAYNRDCDDGVRCTGIEVCDPGSPEADSHGCVQHGPECSEEEGCDESTGRCVTCLVEDEDGDGHVRIACGGDDCDDRDPNRYPGNPEVCDEGHHDEDCDPSTFGLDADDDGYQNATCCNPQREGTACGRDCDDDNALINPDGAEVCGGGDEDCDGVVDEELSELYYRDADMDGDGDPLLSRLFCGRPEPGWSRNADDCDDRDGAIPRTEECEGSVDESCDGAVDEGCACTDGETRPCGPSSEEGECAMGTQSCIAGVWGACADAVFPRAERCNEQDDDCDGRTDEGVLSRYYRDADMDGYGDSGEVLDLCSAPGAGWSSRAGDCDDDAAEVYPGTLERCNAADDDCDGVVDPACACIDGTSRPCGAPDGMGGVLTTGACEAGVQRCIEGRWGSCVGAVEPSAELCDGVDNDCDPSTRDGSGASCAGLPDCCCDGSLRDCNGDLADPSGDGCETDIDSDAASCGACGRSCGIHTRCEGGRCVCDAGWGDCDLDGVDCETDTSASAAHCGACGMICALSDANESCAGGTCRLTGCDPGFGNCDGVDANGCENPLDSLTHCAACGVPCALPNANESCAGDVCHVTTCLTPYANCDGVDTNGCEANLNTNGAHCGACARSCGANASCRSGACECADGFLDCNSDLGTPTSDGCETPYSTTHCGACGATCGAGESCDGLGRCNCGGRPGGTGAGQACVNATCSGGSCVCSGAYEDCDGDGLICEADLMSPSNCGSCGVVCTLGGGTAGGEYCDGGTACTACPGGFHDCDRDGSNGCETVTTVTLDANHCGGCYISCTLDEHCRPEGCSPCPSPEYRDCDRAGINECEINIATDPENCGSCGHSCGPNTICSDSLGVPECSCSPGFHNCDGDFTGNGCESTSPCT